VTIFDRAAADGDVLITADSDFTNLLAARGRWAPSVVLLRHVAELPWREHEALLVANLPAVLTELEDGAVVSLSSTRLAVRRLPHRGRLLDVGLSRCSRRVGRAVPSWLPFGPVPSRDEVVRSAILRGGSICQDRPSCR